MQSNKRIDGLYLYVSPPSLAELEARQRGRLKEADSTMAKRVAWAEAEVTTASTNPQLYDHVLMNEEFDQVGAPDAIIQTFKQF